MDYSHIPTVSCIYSEDTNLCAYNDYDSNPLPHSEAHFEYEMILVVGGKGSVIINHKSYPICRKSLIFISRMEYHSFLITEEPYCRYVTTMSGDLILSNIKDVELVSIFCQRPKEFCHVVQLSDSAFLQLRSLFVRMENEFSRKDAFYVSRSASLVVAILIDLYRSHPEAFPTRSHTGVSTAVINAQRYINDHYKDTIHLQDIAQQNFMSRHALSSAFKDIVGTSFKDYLISFRLTEAKKLLITTDLSVEEIAEAIGYVNVNNFVQIFKKKEALTPLQYRKKTTSL